MTIPLNYDLNTTEGVLKWAIRCGELFGSDTVREEAALLARAVRISEALAGLPSGHIRSLVGHETKSTWEILHDISIEREDR